MCLRKALNGNLRYTDITHTPDCGIINFTVPFTVVNMEDIQGIMPDQWNPCSGISDLYQLLACTFTPHRCWASLKRSLLDMPTKQQYHPEVCQQVG